MAKKYWWSIQVSQLIHNLQKKYNKDNIILVRGYASTANKKDI